MSVLLLIPTVVRSPTAWRAKWETALASVASAPATVLCVGDSITEGQGSSTKEDRWTDRLNAYLQGRYNTGGVGGAGWISGTHAVYGPDSPWAGYSSQSGTITAITTVGDIGFRAASMATGAVRTYTLTGTSVDIYWQRASGNGSFTWAVDGGSATTVSTAGTTSTTTKTTVTLGATVGASHTLTITATTGPVVLEGVFVYNGDETNGPRMWEAGHTAWDTNQYLNHADYTNFAAFVTSIAPNLVLIQLGFNDYMNNTVTPASYSTNLSKLLTTLDGLANRPSILLIDSYDYGGTQPGTATQADFRTVLLNLVSADPDYRAYLNFGDTMPPTDTTGAGYYRTDGIHPNDSGYTEINRQISIAVTPWSAPSPITATATVVDIAYQQGYGPATGTLATETFTGTDGASWPAQWTITPNSGAATIQSNAGRLDPVSATAYATGPWAYLSGMTATVDTDLLFAATFSSTGEQYLNFAVRSTGVVDGNGYPDNCYFIQMDAGTGGGYFGVIRNINGTRTDLTPSGTWNRAFSVTIGQKMWLRLRVIGSAITVTHWADGVAEPSTATWQLAADPSPYSSAGQPFFVTVNGATGPQVVTLDNVTVTDGTASQVTPPSAHPTQMATWNAAVEYRDYRQATWLAIGDSITEGQAATARTNRWIDQAVTALRTAYPTTGAAGGTGFLPAYYNLNNFSQSYSSRAVGAGSLADETGIGFGGRTTAIGPGATVTYSITGSGMDVWWVAGGGSLTVTIDGTLVSSINTAGTSGTGNHSNRFLFSSTGAHTIVLGASGSTARFSGIQVHNGDENKGIRLIDAAHSGWRTVDYTDSNYVDLWAAASPDLVTIMLGLNDRGQGTSAATMKTNIQTFIANLRAALPTKPPSFAVCVTWSLDLDQPTWDPYAAWLRNIANDDPTIGIIDFYKSMGPATDTTYWNSDGLHPNDTGHAFMGSQAASYLTTGAVPADEPARASAALTHVGASAWVTPASAATVSPTYPTGLADGDQVYAFLHIKPDTATVATPTNWTLIGSAAGGSGSLGVGTGITKVWAFKRTIPVGGGATLSGTAEAFTITGGDSPMGFMRAYRATGASIEWTETVASWSVATASTTFGGTAGNAMILGVLDEITVIIGASDDQPGTSGLALTGLTASGATLGTLTQSPTGTAVNAQGNDIAATAYRVPVTLGNSSSAPVATATSATSETGMGFLLRVRATAVLPSPLPSPSVVTQAALTRAGSW